MRRDNKLEENAFNEGMSSGKRKGFVAGFVTGVFLVSVGGFGVYELSKYFELRESVGKEQKAVRIEERKPEEGSNKCYVLDKEAKRNYVPCRDYFK